jgi:hypothetical protein
MFETFTEPPPIKPYVKGLLALWFVLLIPWLPVTAVSASVLSNTWDANLFFWSPLTYPITLSVAFIFKRKVPRLSLLPLLNVAGFFLGGFSNPWH